MIILPVLCVLTFLLCVHTIVFTLWQTVHCVVLTVFVFVKWYWLSCACLCKVILTVLCLCKEILAVLRLSCVKWYQCLVLVCVKSIDTVILAILHLSVFRLRYQQSHVESTYSVIRIVVCLSV